MAKKKRVDFRKNRSKPPRANDWTSGFQKHGFADEATVAGERVRSKGDLSRKRTIQVEDGGLPSVDLAACIQGRVLRVHGLDSVVQMEDGRLIRAKIRRLLKTMSTDERNVLATGDHVWVRPSLNDEGIIEGVEPRHGILTRASRGREHVLVANVDQVVIVMALVEPDLKPHLIDRYLASAAMGQITPIICLNKVDLVDPIEYQPTIGFYSQLGVTTLLTSASSGQGLDVLRRLLKNRETVFSGQSGVGKSSLLNVDSAGAWALQSPRGKRRQSKRQAHDDDFATPATRFRRLGRGYARDSTVRFVGHHSRRSGGVLHGIPAVRVALWVSRLHAHARRPLRREAGRATAADRRAAVSELFRFVFGETGMKAQRGGSTVCGV